MPGADHSILQIIETRDHIVIFNEWGHQTRVVRIRDRAHWPSTIRAWSGDPVGRWEGNTFVIDSTNFRDSSSGPQLQLDQNLHLTERFTRAGPETLLYEFTVDDPAAYTKPWTAAVPMKKSDEKIYEHACHEGNYSMEFMLSGARAQEKEAER